MKTAEAQQTVDALVAALGDCFMDGNCVQLANFGSFEVKKKLERIMVSPTTGHAGLQAQSCMERQNKERRGCINAKS